MNDKQGLELIVDRIEALRVRLEYFRIELEGGLSTSGHAVVASSSITSIGHWVALCVEAKTEAVKMMRDSREG